MTIPDYAALLIDAGEYSGYADISHVFPRLLGLAELKLNRGLRVAGMENTEMVTLTEGDGTLPDDFLEAREVKNASGIPIRAVSLEQLTNSYMDRSGTPAGYAIVGSTIKVRPTADQDISVTYYSKIPALTVTDPTNWLLEKAPDVYLFALVNEIAIWKRDVEAATAAQQLMLLAINGLKIEDERARWGNAQMVVGGVTP
ncbi:phage adaptor protein [Sinorhizobium fredii]|uniref:phage adaptor protein n=1 Tax=Rhizobium fredii TaxID=380 RepID=UPI003518E587